MRQVKISKWSINKKYSDWGLQISTVSYNWKTLTNEKSTIYSANLHPLWTRCQNRKIFILYQCTFLIWSIAWRSFNFQTFNEDIPCVSTRWVPSKPRYTQRAFSSCLTASFPLKVLPSWSPVSFVPTIHCVEQTMHNTSEHQHVHFRGIFIFHSSYFFKCTVIHFNVYSKTCVFIACKVIIGIQTKHVM